MNQALHELLMKRCFDLARRAEGLTSPNPMVGSLIANSDQVISEGFHPGFQLKHAEICAIENVPNSYKWPERSTLYVSLEPCFHQGYNPPCVDAIIHSPIRNVVISCQDPNPLVSGKSIAKLRSAGIHVIENILRKEGEELIAPFMKRMKNNRPYIILKWAQTSDGYIGLPGRQVWISNRISKIFTHKWRKDIDAILVGTNTAILDNPQLTNRLFYGKDPIRIVIDKNLKVPKTHHLLTDQIRTYVFTAEGVKDSKWIHYIQIDFDKSVPEQILNHLFHLNINVLLIEGGSQTLSTFITHGLWDEAWVTINQEMILKKGIPAPKIPQKGELMFSWENDMVYRYQS